MTPTILRMTPVAQSPWNSRPVWTAAAAVALALHLACAGLAAWALSGDDPDPELGAPAIEIGVELLAPRGEPTDLAPGPEADKSAPAPEAAAQKMTPDPADLPKANPVETDDPDRQVAIAEPEKPKDEIQPKPTVDSQPSAPSAASEATATPNSEALEASTRSVAPAQGSGESPERIRASWQKELLAHLNRFKRYPEIHAGDHAEILVDLAIDEEGRVTTARIVKGSGSDSFDEAALAMIRRADPVPKPPPIVAQSGLRFTLPVIFRAKRSSR